MTANHVRKRRKGGSTER